MAKYRGVMCRAAQPRVPLSLSLFASLCLPRFVILLPFPSTNLLLSASAGSNTRKQPHMRAVRQKERKRRATGTGKVYVPLFDQLGLINGVHGGVVDDDDGGRERREDGKYYSSGPSGLWVYAIKNVNICRRLVIGCKYGGRPKRQMGGVNFQLLCFVIYWNVGHGCNKPTLIQPPSSGPGTVLVSRLRPCLPNVSIYPLVHLPFPSLPFTGN